MEHSFRVPPRAPRLRGSSGWLVLALLAGCHASAVRPGPVVLTHAPPAAARPDEAAIAGAFRALQGALEGGDDEGAARLAAGLRARALQPRELELVASAERVLTGRALVRGLDLALESEQLEDGQGYRLVLVARSDAGRDLRLHLPPADLKRMRASMDARGMEGLEYESRASQALVELVLAPTVVRRMELLRYELPLGRALAVRERWRLDPRAGEIECDGVAYPAAALKVRGCERERLSPLLAGEPAGAGELAAALAGERRPTKRELLELALRTGVHEREDCLRALAPAVARVAQTEPERVAAAEPALRWLTQNRDLGPDAAAWSRWLAARTAEPAGPSPAPGGLDLPPRQAQRREGEW